MAKCAPVKLFILLNLGTLLSSLAWPHRPCPTPLSEPPKHHPSKVLPPPHHKPSKPPVTLTPPAATPTPPIDPPSPPPETPSPPPTPPPVPKQESCSVDPFKLGECVDVIGGRMLGSSSNEACCSLIQGLEDLDAALCLCTAIKSKLLEITIGIDITIEIALGVLVGCGKSPPPGFECPA